MKYIVLLGILVCIAGSASNCKVQQKITYMVPPHFSKEEKANFLQEMDKGLALYKENCSGCHGIFTKGRDNVPNFTHQQVENYSSSYIKGDKKNHAVVIDMSPAQFFCVMNFLTSRVVDTTGQPVHVAPRPEVLIK